MVGLGLSQVLHGPLIRNNANASMSQSKVSHSFKRNFVLEMVCWEYDVHSGNRVCWKEAVWSGRRAG